MRSGQWRADKPEPAYSSLLHIPLPCPLPPTPGEVKAPLWGFFILLQKLFLSRGGGVEDAIASSDITKAPFVTLIALCGDLRINGIKRPL